MSRLSTVDEKSDPRLSEVFERILRTRGYVANIQKSFGHAPEGMRRFAALGEYVRYQTDLSARVREIAILAVVRGVEYAWFHHRPHALNAGVTKSELAQLKGGEMPGTFDDPEKAAIRYVQEFTEDGNVSDATFEAARQHYSERQITDLTFLAGYFMALGATINAFRVELEPMEVLKAVGHAK